MLACAHADMSQHQQCALTPAPHLSPLMQAVYQLAEQRDVLDVTAEDPSEPFLLVRERVDVERAVGCDWLIRLVSGGGCGADMAAMMLHSCCCTLLGFDPLMFTVDSAGRPCCCHAELTAVACCTHPKIKNTITNTYM
jgi:hypothetical protein